MAFGDLTSRDAVQQAMREFDQLGRDDFLRKYGFGPARQYMLLHEGRAYDSKAIVGVAHAYQFPNEGPLNAREFSGGVKTVCAKLSQLGFDVR